MSDNKSMQDGRDRSKVSASEDYEVNYMAEKFGVSAQDVRDAIQEIGNDRRLVEAQIQKAKQDERQP